MECVICYVFLLLLCLLDAHYVLFTLFVFKFCKFGFYCCSLLSSNSKWFNGIFWLAGKCGTPLFNNKPVLTWLSLKKLSSSRIFKDLLSSAGNNFDTSKSFERFGQLHEPYLLLQSITPLNTQHNFAITLIDGPSLERKNPLWNKRSAWQVSIDLPYLLNGIWIVYTSHTDSSGSSFVVDEVVLT